MTKEKDSPLETPGAGDLARLPWRNQEPDGTKYALLEGDRNVSGAVFTYAFFLPAGFWDPPHWHTQAARIVVLEGVLRLGYGDKLDQSSAEEYPAGSILYVPAQAVHFDGAAEDTTICGIGQGEWRTAYLDPSQQGSAGTRSVMEIGSDS